MSDVFKKVQKLNIPSPFTCTSIVSFFEFFIEINSNNESFTHRKFAELINWPISLCANLSKGRKGLSVKRLLEFSRFCEFSSLEVDRMFYLLSKEQFSNNTSSTEFIDDIYSIRYQGKKFSDEQYTSNILKFYIIKVVKWLGYIPKAKEIKDLIYLVDFEIEDIEMTLLELQTSNAFIANDEGVIEFKNELLESDKDLDSSVLHSHFGLNYSEYCRNPEGDGMCNSGFVELNKNQVKEVEVRILELRNWIVSLGKQNNSAHSSSTSIYQADLNLFPVIKKN